METDTWEAPLIFQEKTGIIPSYRVQAPADTPVVQSMNGVKALVVGYPRRPGGAGHGGTGSYPTQEFGQNLWRW